MKKRRNYLLVCILFVVSLFASSCSGKDKSLDPVRIKDYQIEHETEFGGVYIQISIDDFNAVGFAYGDSVDVEFSNGYSLKDIPYFNGYYVDPGEALLISYPGYKYVKVSLNYGEDVWKLGKLDDSMTASVKLVERGKYLDIQKARDIHYYDDRENYPSDEVFANFREVTAGNISKGTFYRSASPCDNQHNRAPYVDRLIEKAEVGCILDLADDVKKIEKYISKDDFDSGYFLELYSDGKVIPLAMSMNFYSDDFTSKLADGLRRMASLKGPYLVHCTEGKDRTGFVCMILEALCGATYSEIVDDYMITYDNYYEINPEKDNEKYELIRDKNLIPMIKTMVGDDKVDITKADLSIEAFEYLLDAGMTEQEIEMLIEHLCK